MLRLWDVYPGSNRHRILDPDPLHWIDKNLSIFNPKIVLPNSRKYVPEMFIPDPGSGFFPGSGSAALDWIYHDCVAGAAMAARLAWSSWQEGGDSTLSSPSSVLRWRGESMDTFQPRISQGDMSQWMHFFPPGSKPNSSQNCREPRGIIRFKIQDTLPRKKNLIFLRLD